MVVAVGVGTNSIHEIQGVCQSIHNALVFLAKGSRLDVVQVPVGRVMEIRKSLCKFNSNYDKGLAIMRKAYFLCLLFSQSPWSKISIGLGLDSRLTSQDGTNVVESGCRMEVGTEFHQSQKKRRVVS